MIFNSQISIVNHRLTGNGVVHLQCAKNTRKLVGPDMIVLHYTGGTSPMSSALFLTRPDVAASAHLVIGREGELVQLVPFNIEAWHAGRSWYAGRAELNHYSIGIELDNLGKLRVEGNTFVAECGRKVKPEDVHADCSGEESLHECTGENVGRGVQVTGIQLPDPGRGRALGHHEPENRPGTGAGIRLGGSILDL